MTRRDPVERVWIVDDSAVDRVSMARALEGSFEVETFDDATVAIERLGTASVLPDVLITDWVMPVVDGLEVCRFVRRHARTSSVALLMVTVHQSTNDLVAALECGADDFLRKPYELAELVARVRSLARSRRSERAQALALARLDRLQHLTAALAACVSADDVASALLEHASAELGAVGCGLAVREGDSVRLWASAGFQADVVRAFERTALSDPLPITEACRENRAIWVESYESMLRLYPALSQHVRRGRRWAALPMRVSGMPMGVLALTLEGEQAYSQEERVLLERLADVAAAALDRARLYDEESSARKSAAASAAFEKELIAIVSHDLRNPLTAASLSVHHALQAESVADAQKRIERAGRAIRRMRTLIDQLLDLTRVRIGTGIPIDRAPWDLATIVQAVATEARDGHPGVDIRVDVNGDTRGEWDGDRIAQVLANLVGNAAQHGGTSKQVHVIVRDLGERVSVAVHNDGAPIPDSERAAIFEPFARGGSSNGQGLGLGLYIAREIVLLHGGTIDVSSDEESGTTFAVILPRR